VGLTELFFETVEPENADVPIKQMLAKLPEGKYTIAGPAQGERQEPGSHVGHRLAYARHPGGPDARLSQGGRHRACAWRRRPLDAGVRDDHGQAGDDHAYQLLIEKNVEPHRHMIGKLGLSMYLPRSVTRIALPNGFLRRRTAYKREVLAIERGGNQTLSSGSFPTR
jgi:hypothetical protein